MSASQLPRLPLADEVSAARAQADAAALALGHVQRLAAAEQALLILEEHRARWPHMAVDLGAADLLAEVHARWGLPVHEGEGDPIAARRALLQRLRAELMAEAEKAQDRADALRLLIHQQAGHIQDPDLAETVQSVKSLSAERDACLIELRPLQQQQARIAPTIASVRGLRDRLDVLAAERHHDDPHGQRALRAERMCAAVVAQLDAELTGLGLQAELPEPSGSDPWARLDNVRTGLGALIDQLEADRARVDARVGELASRADALASQVFGLTG